MSPGTYLPQLLRLASVSTQGSTASSEVASIDGNCQSSHHLAFYHCIISLLECYGSQQDDDPATGSLTDLLLRTNEGVASVQSAFIRPIQNRRDLHMGTLEHAKLRACSEAHATYLPRGDPLGLRQGTAPRNHAETCANDRTGTDHLPPAPCETRAASRAGFGATVCH